MEQDGGHSHLDPHGSTLEQPCQAAEFVNLLLIARHLERVGDHATNITGQSGWTYTENTA
jgi:phosphate uptake regulator